MNCPACHAPNPMASRFCSHCGTVLATPVAPPPYAPPPADARPSPVHAPLPAYAAPPAYAPPLPGSSAQAVPVDAASGLIARITGITLKPKDEWPVIAAEPPSLGRTIVGCVLPLAGIQAALSFVHMAVIGVSVPFAGSVRMPMVSSLTSVLMGFVFAVIGCFVFALIVNVWAPFFSGRRNLGEALKVAAYTSVPAWLGAFLGILPYLGVLFGLVAAIYAIYVLYLGLPVVMRSPRERAFGYTVAVLLTGIVLGGVVGGAMAAAGGMGRFGMPGAAAEASVDRSSDEVGHVIGNVLGTDDRGKAALGEAIGNLARAGRQMQESEAARAATSPAAPPPPQATATPAQTADAAAMPAPQDMANAGAAVGGLLNALGGALGGSHRVTPVDFRILGKLLPASLGELPRGPVEGANKQAMGVHGSSASASYGSAGSSRIDLKISDVSGLSGLIGIAGKLDQTTDAQTADGFERDVVLGGRHVHEKFTNTGRHGELQVFVANRFSVDLDGIGLDVGTLEQALSQVDLGRLESMKDVGVQN